MYVCVCISLSRPTTVGGGFPDLRQSRTGEAVSCRDNACGGVFDSGYVQLAGLRAQLHADGSPIIHYIVHGCVTWQIGGGW